MVAADTSTAPAPAHYPGYCYAGAAPCTDEHDRRPATLSSKPRAPRISPAECARLCTVLGGGCVAWHHATRTAACTLGGAGITAAADARGLDRSGNGPWRHNPGDESGTAITGTARTNVEGRCYAKESSHLKGSPNLPLAEHAAATAKVAVRVARADNTVECANCSDCKGATNVVIPDSVTAIGVMAFYGCSSLAAVTIGDSVTAIGAYAFYGCSSLAAATIGDSVAAIGGWAFQGCTSLAAVTIPDSATAIGISAFQGCTSLATVTVGDSVTYIEQRAFQDCTSLAAVTIPGLVKIIGQFAFDGCTNLAAVTIPDSATEIREWVFQGCTSLAAVTIPDSATAIAIGMFQGCTSLAAVIIGGSVTAIGINAFHGCTSLVAVTIPDSVTAIGGEAFYGCTSLAAVTIPCSVTDLDALLYAFQDTKCCSGACNYQAGTFVKDCSTGHFACPETTRTSTTITTTRTTTATKSTTITTTSTTALTATSNTATFTTTTTTTTNTQPTTTTTTTATTTTTTTRTATTAAPTAGDKRCTGKKCGDTCSMGMLAVVAWCSNDLKCATTGGPPQCDDSGMTMTKTTSTTTSPTTPPPTTTATTTQVKITTTTKTTITATTTTAQTMATTRATTAVATRKTRDTTNNNKKTTKMVRTTMSTIRTTASRVTIQTTTTTTTATVTSAPQTTASTARARNTATSQHPGTSHADTPGASTLQMHSTDPPMCAGDVFAGKCEDLFVQENCPVMCSSNTGVHATSTTPSPPGSKNGGGSMVGPAVGAAIGVALLLLVGYAGVRLKDRRRRAALSGAEGMELSLVESEYSAVGQDAILTRSQVELGRMLGKGEFGKVYSGKVFPSGGGAMVVAAVKEPSTSALADFAEEVDIVCKVYRLGGHANIAGMIGFVPCGQNGDVPLLALELCERGDVKSFLRKQGALPSEELLPMCVDVASGMEFLETALIVHRDLAARNVLLATNMQCKIADFGLSRNTGGKDYYRRNANSAPIPVRWMAPETLTHDVSTLSSDRWSFGIFMWEVYTFGERPYAGMQNTEVLGQIVAGRRLRHPEGCPDAVYQAMQRCWSDTPDLRPAFGGAEGLVALLSKL